MQFARQLADAAMELAFERGKPQFGSLESLLGRIGRRNTDLGQARGLLSKRGDGLLVNLSELRAAASGPTRLPGYASSRTSTR